MGRKKATIKKGINNKVPEDEDKLYKITMDRDSKLQEITKKAGFDFNAIAPKMEEYKSILKWNEDSFAYMKARVEVLKEMAQLINTIGVKASDLMIEIQRISYFIDLLERKLVEEGRNPLESKAYINALKMKKEMITEYNKLQIDYNKAVVDYKYKKALKPEMDEDFTVMNDKD